MLKRLDRQQNLMKIDTDWLDFPSFHSTSSNHTNCFRVNAEEQRWQPSRSPLLQGLCTMCYFCSVILLHQLDIYIPPIVEESWYSVVCLFKVNECHVYFSSVSDLFFPEICCLINRLSMNPLYSSLIFSNIFPFFEELYPTTDLCNYLY